MSTSIESSKLFDVKGLVAVVTGGGTGLGLMITKALEHNGGIVYIVGRRLEVLKKAAEENNRHGNIIPIQGDVTSKESLQEVVSLVKEKSGYIDLLVNNSGISGPSALGRKPNQTVKEFAEFFWNQSSIPEFNKTFEVNVAGVFYTTLAFLELLDAGNKRGRGSGGGVTSQVITISSIGGMRNDKNVASFGYQASKAAVLHLGKMFANSLVQYGIRSNIVCPGIFPSDMGASVFQQAMDEETVVSPDFIPLKRTGNTSDMGGLVLYLASRAGAYLNGNVTIIDGGRLGASGGAS